MSRKTEVIISKVEPVGNPNYQYFFFKAYENRTYDNPKSLMNVLLHEYIKYPYLFSHNPKSKTINVYSHELDKPRSNQLHFATIHYSHDNLPDLPGFSEYRNFMLATGLLLSLIEATAGNNLKVAGIGLLFTLFIAIKVKPEKKEK